MDAVPFDEPHDDGYRLNFGSVDHAQSASSRERSRHMCEHGFFIQPASGGARMDSREGSFAACLRKACWVAVPRRLVASLRLFARSRAVHGRARRPLARGDELVVQADGGRREEAVGEIPAANGQELAQEEGRRHNRPHCGSRIAYAVNAAEVHCN